ncbi:hypothetical protein [Acrocarpospora catenulata]|uniref:hypothetical protein n=1 Tax=Acrocarpospora catenulata TaxID=2836182 RepID=UPI001BDA8080|nr:hypothetical protein [Acrocarpospora catenulata]
MNDDDVLGTVRDGMAGVRMHTPVQKLVAAGRSRRRRRMGGATAGAALATGVALTLAINIPQVNAPPTGNQVHVSLAAFSVDTNPDGTVTVKVTKEESLDPELMQRTLAQAGVPAQITINKWCRPSDESQNLQADLEKVLREEPQPGSEQDALREPQIKTDRSVQQEKPKTENDVQQERQLKAEKDVQHAKQPSAENDVQQAGTILVITPSAMPPGTKLIMGMRTPGYQPDSPSRVAASIALVPDDAPLTCTTDVPMGPPREPRPTPGS